MIWILSYWAVSTLLALGFIIYSEKCLFTFDLVIAALLGWMMPAVFVGQVFISLLERIDKYLTKHRLNKVIWRM